MLHAFEHIDVNARAGQRRAYRQFLAERDGELDVVRRRLSLRDKSIDRYETQQQKRELDTSLFEAQYNKFDKKLATSPEMLLLLALVKLNGAEAYGVNYSFEGMLRKVEAGAEDDAELVLLIEEHYHTRILLSSARLYGVEVGEAFLPPFSLRTLIASIAAVPQALARPLVLASEVYGTLLFHALLKRTGQVLKDSPELRDAIEERITEVLIDEIGHVTFNRMQLSSWGLFQARRLLPMVRMGLGDFVPELRMLGVDRMADLDSMNALPAEVRRHAFIV